MKIYCSCLLIVFLAVLSGCTSLSGYKEAALRHYAYASGEEDTTAEEWRELVSEFQHVISTDPRGPFADDAQYAVASSWMWSITTGDTRAPQEAIEAFQTLVRTYPNSPYVPHAHYWLGRCYAYVNQDYQAITQYQIVENRYADSKLLEPAQLELARLYTRQGYRTRAEAFYKDLVSFSTDPEIVAAASAELQALQQKQPLLAGEKRGKTGTPSKRPVSTLGKEVLNPGSLTREFGLIAKTIVIDPGHGGQDPGAVGSGTLQEKSIVLNISEKLRQILMSRGYTVLMTRENNRFISLKDRTKFATRHKADLFLSIHANGSKSPQTEGIETYYLNVSSTDEISEQIAARENANSGYSIQELESLLKGLIQESKSEDSKRLATEVQHRLVQATGAVDRGVKYARFVVLIGTNVPSILVEAGFVSNPTEARKLATPAYQHKIATAIAEGVDSFLQKTSETPFAKSQSPKIVAKSLGEDQ